jgi:hypothetical protein
MRLLALAVVLASAPADAAVPPQVTASLHGTTAHFALHVVAETNAATFPAASIQLALPVGGVVTAATVTIAGTHHPLALTPAGTANDTFYALGERDGPSQAWAVLLASAGESVSIDIAAPAHVAVAIDLEVEAATCFERDQRFVDVPKAWKLATAHAPAHCGAHDEMAWVAFASPPPDHIGTIGGRLVLPTADIARVELDLARELADIPADLHTAIVIDASRSLTASDREEQRAIVAAYLQRVPHSSVQLVGYSRRGAPMLDGWTSNDSPAIDRELRAMHLANGSNLDAGLAEAGAWLARTTGTKRVLVFTDERLPPRLRGDDGTGFASFVPPGTLVHVIALGRVRGVLKRDDDVMFGGLAIATGGIGVLGAITASPDATLLVRPISVDDVAVKGEGWSDLPVSSDCTGSLPAGTSCTWWGQGDASSGPITLTGKLWNRPVARIIRPDATRALSIARELSATSILEPSLQAEVERAALAANAAWSLFAQWGGDGGYPGETGVGTLSGTASGHTSSTIVDTIGVAHVVPIIDLRPQLAGALARCGDVHASIEIQLTRDEIVDVRVDRATGAAQSCLEDAVWGTLVTVPGTPEVSRTTIIL